MEQIKLLFVCLGNICRSPMAEAILKKKVKERRCEDRFLIDSAGTYGGHAGELPDRRMRVHGQQRGYTFDHRSRKVCSSDFDRFDYIIAMDDSNFEDLKALAPTLEAEQKIRRMADFFHHPHYDYVPDPYYSGAEGFELVIDLLEEGCEELLEVIH